MNERIVAYGRVLVLAGLMASVLSARAWGQTPAAPAAQPDFSKVEIKTTKLAGNFYTLDGQGGTIGVLAGPDGVLMVDSQFAPLTEKIVAAIRTISDGRIRFMINTHVHPDHTGGNENLGKMGVTIIARDELRARLAKGGNAGPPPAAALPLVTYRGGMTFHMNGEDVQLVAIPAAHTDGDTMVYFPNANVIMTGDYYRSIQYPNIDRANGGTLKGLLDAFETTINRANATTKIVPGHGAPVDKTAVAAHRDMVIALRDKVAALVKQGKTQEEVVAAKLTADYDSKVQQVGTTGDRFITQLYQELSGK
jgi:glyoxylase-like metal-dependent hydrolase (beta-lactamase superfamily II)